VEHSKSCLCWWRKPKTCKYHRKANVLLNGAYKSTNIIVDTALSFIGSVLII